MYLQGVPRIKAALIDPEFVFETYLGMVIQVCNKIQGNMLCDSMKCDVFTIISFAILCLYLQ
jgi:hypothetical protein